MCVLFCWLFFVIPYTCPASSIQFEGERAELNATGASPENEKEIEKVRFRFVSFSPLANSLKANEKTKKKKRVESGFDQIGR